MSAGAERMRRRRQRRARGMVVLPVEVDEVDHVEMLLATGFLPPHQAEDRDAIAKATARLLANIQIADVVSRR